MVVGRFTLRDRGWLWGGGWTARVRQLSLHGKVPELRQIVGGAQLALARLGVRYTSLDQVGGMPRLELAGRLSHEREERRAVTMSRGKLHN